MWYGFLSETKEEGNLSEICIVTPPYNTQEEASKALKAKEHILYSGEHRQLCLDKFYGNQHGAINLDGEVTIPEGCLGVRINVY